MSTTIGYSWLNLPIHSFLFVFRYKIRIEIQQQVDFEMIAKFLKELVILNRSINHFKPCNHPPTSLFDEILTIKGKEFPTNYQFHFRVLGG